MNIILIAPPAAGKGTQSELICNKYDIKHISTGDLIRTVINSNNEKSIELKKTIEQGKLVSDEFVLDLIKDEIKDGNSYIFDGFPRTVNQAKLFDELLEKLNEKIDYVIYLDINKEMASKRILGRLSCSNCGKVYNDQIEESMPKINGICDDCNIELSKRNDDNEETFNKRFDTYMSETKPLLDYYKDRLYIVDSSLNKYEIFKQIENIIGA
mgnify:FL=1